MRVLVTVEPDARHPYVDNLVRSLEGRGLDVEVSAARFSSPDPSYDVLHVQWPEALCGWERPSEERVREIRRGLERWKEEGAALVVTRHNALPHAYRNPAAKELYERVLSSASGIVHLGRASHDELAGAYDSIQVVIPHGHDPDADPVARSDARGDLGLDPDAFVVLVFGAIRHFEEKRLVLRAFERLPVRNRACVVPRWHEATRPSWRRSPLRRIADHLTDWRARRTMRVDDGIVEPERVGHFFGAADVVLIPRIRALNSGVLPLAYSHGRPVVGPAIGNIERIVEDTGNFLYRAGDPEDAAAALGRAHGSDLDALGRKNRSHAAERWGWEGIARRHHELYRRASERR